MSTNGVNNVVYTRDDIIKEALSLNGAIADGEDPTAAQLTSCARTLNMLIDLWQTDGLQLFRRKEYSVALVAGTKTYTFGSGGTLSTEVPTRILAGWRRSADTIPIDTQLSPISATDYWALASKSSTGTIVSYYFNYQGADGASVTVWPTPQSGVTDTLYVVGERPMYNVSAASDDVDVPNWYYLPLAYALAAAIGPKYGCDSTTLTYLTQMGSVYKAEALSYDIEYNTSLYIQPEYQGN